MGPLNKNLRVENCWMHHSERLSFNTAYQNVFPLPDISVQRLELLTPKNPLLCNTWESRYIVRVHSGKISISVSISFTVQEEFNRQADPLKITKLSISQKRKWCHQCKIFPIRFRSTSIRFESFIKIDSEVTENSRTQNLYEKKKK